MPKKIVNSQDAYMDIVNNVAKLNFGDLLLLNAMLSEHLHNCYQHHLLQAELTKEKIN